MKNTLAENLLRFGAKNLSEDAKTKLAEQADPNLGRFIGQEFPLQNFGGGTNTVVYALTTAAMPGQAQVGDSNVLKFYVASIKPAMNPNRLQIVLGNNQTKETAPLTLSLQKMSDGSPNVTSAKFYGAEKLNISQYAMVTAPTQTSYDFNPVDRAKAIQQLQTPKNYNTIPMITELVKLIPA